jgi:ABC-type transporter Mla MlaB component
LMSQASLSEVSPKPYFGTRAGNQSSLFATRIDERGLWARRTRELVQNIAGDLGGMDALSEAQKQLVRRLAGLSVLCEQLEIELASGERLDAQALAAYLQTVNSARRLSSTLGLRRIPKDVTPSLEAYLEQRYGEAAE